MTQEPALKKARLALKAVAETDVGITQYLNGRPAAFSGVLKLRISDFQVNEIDKDGNVVRLSDEGIDTGLTKKERRLEQRQKDRDEFEGKTEEEIEKIKQQRQEAKYTLTEEHRAQLLTFVTLDELAEMESLFSTGGKMETSSTFSDKERRTQLHQLVRVAFQSKLETLTTPEQLFKIALSKGKGRRNHSDHTDSNGVLNYGLGKYREWLHFTVFKESRDTMEVALTICRLLRVPNKTLKFAGTKDRRGATCQRFALQKAKVMRVNALNRALKGAVLGGFAYEDADLGLGDLKGNDFLIALRDVRSLGDKPLEEAVEESFQSLQHNGFINYFGMQRFGTFSISTHVLGIMLLKSDWKGAVELILAEQDRVVPELVEARRKWAETKDAAEALKLMPRRFTAEHAVLTSLAKEKTLDDQAYFRAIMQIPNNLRLIYVHAYQSYVWNLVVSKRIELFGTAVQEGDLILVEAKNGESKVVKEIVNGEEFEEDVAGTASDKVRALTREEAELGAFTIYDVVLPTPGHDVTYPANRQIMEVYESAMAKDGLDPHSMTRRRREFSLGGSYRPIVGRVENLHYKIVHYSEPTDTILHTDLEILRAQREESVLTQQGGVLIQQEGNDSESTNKPRVELPRVVDNAAGEKTAVVLGFRLGVSSYATMAIREFVKTLE